PPSLYTLSLHDALPISGQAGGALFNVGQNVFRGTSLLPVHQFNLNTANQIRSGSVRAFDKGSGVDGLDFGHIKDAPLHRQYQLFAFLQRQVAAGTDIHHTDIGVDVGGQLVPMSERAGQHNSGNQNRDGQPEDLQRMLQGGMQKTQI